MFKILIFTFFLSIVSGQDHNQEFGDIHADPKAFREEFKSHHKKEDVLGDVKASEVFEEDEQDDRYYWFSLHDYNNDEHLDGHELRYAWMASNPEKYSKEVVEPMVDKIIERDDTDNDGRISWAEYLSANNK